MRSSELRDHRCRPPLIPGWRPRSGVNGSGAGSTVMLGGGDGLVDHLLWGGRVEELAAQVL
jgi:hypothetical protein